MGFITKLLGKGYLDLIRREIARSNFLGSSKPY
jgi:hypothetical protein